MMAKTSAALLLMPFLISPGDEPAPPRGEVIAVTHCEIGFSRASLLGSPVMGVLGECSVRPGDAVKAGQVLGRLVDRDVRSEYELRVASAESEVEIKIAEARLAQSKTKLRRLESLRRRNMTSNEEVEDLTLETYSRELEVESARQKRRIAQLQEKQGASALKDREFVSPFDGVVLAVLKSPGESVAINDPVIRVVDDTLLRVTGHLDIVDAAKVRAGRRVRIRPEIPGAELAVEKETFEGQVVFIDSEMDRQTQTVKVIAEVENRARLLRAGVEATMEILPDSAPTAPDKPAATISAQARSN